jgi:hypothetical protein
VIRRLVVNIDGKLILMRSQAETRKRYQKVDMVARNLAERHSDPRTLRKAKCKNEEVESMSKGLSTQQLSIAAGLLVETYSKMRTERHD